MKAVATVTLAATVAVMSTTVALGCGDKLSVIGGGVGYDRITVAGARGNVVLLLAPDSRLRNANDELKLKRELEFAGHKVQVVQSASALKPVVSSGGTDVVLVTWQDATRVQTELAGNPTPPTVLGVTYGDEPDAATTSKGICVTKATKPRGRELVQTVGQTVKHRKAGEPVECKPATTSL